MNRICFRFTFWAFLPVALVILTLAPSATAQLSEIGIGLNGSSYVGDISPSLHYANVRPGGELFYRRNFSPALSGNVAVGYNWLNGDDANFEGGDPFAERRGYSFDANIITLTGTFEYNFFNFRGDKALRKWSPYLLFGGGVASANVSASTELASPEGVFDSPSGAIPLVIYGAGMKHELGHKFNLSYFIRATRTFTDQLDGLSSEDTVPKSFRGNPNDFDRYYTIGVAVSYRFIMIRCPQGFRN